MPTSPLKGPDSGIGGSNYGTKTHKDDHGFFCRWRTGFMRHNPCLSYNIGKASTPLKKVHEFPVSSRDVTNHTPPGQE